VARQEATKDSNVEFNSATQTFLNARKRLQLMQQDMNSQGQRNLFSSGGGGGRGLEQ